MLGGRAVSWMTPPTYRNGSLYDFGAVAPKPPTYWFRDPIKFSFSYLNFGHGISAMAITPSVSWRIPSSMIVDCAGY
jgi:hypothetical protein